MTSLSEGGCRMPEYISLDQKPQDNDGIIVSYTPKIQAFIDIENDIGSLSRSDASIWSSLHLVCFHGTSSKISEYCGGLSRDSLKTDINIVAGKRSITSLFAAVIGYCAKTDGTLEGISLLLDQSNIDMFIPDKDGYNVLHYAAYFGNTTVMEILISRCESEQQYELLNCRGRRYKMTPLILAFYSFNDGKHNNLTNVTRWFLQQPNTDLLLADNNGFNALYCACILRQQSLIQIILSENLDSTKFQLIAAQAQNGTTCLSYVASKYDKVTCELLVSFLPRDIANIQSENKDCSSFSLHYGQEASTVNILIKYAPEHFTQLLDKSISIKTHILKSDSLSVEFSYLEPYIGNTYHPHVYDYGTCPLRTIARYKVRSLLSHPAVEYLIKRKWESLEYRVYLYVQLFYFLFFMSMLLVYENQQIPPEVALARNCTATPGGGYTEKEECRKNHLCLASGYFVFVMSVIRLALEGLDLIHAVGSKLQAAKNKAPVKKKSPFSGAVDTIRRQPGVVYILAVVKGFTSYLTSAENILQVSLFSAAGIFSFNVTQPEPISSNAWQTGALCVFLSFIHFLVLIRIVTVIGQHVTIFLKITKTFIKNISVLFIGLLVAFLIIFHMLLGQHPVWKNLMTFKSIYKVVSMGASGVEFDHFGEYDSVVYYPVATACGFIAFAVLVQVMFLNLAMGLALNDVQDARKNAAMKRKIIKINAIYDIEEVFKKLETVMRWFPCFGRNFNIFKKQRRVFVKEGSCFVPSSSIIAWQERVNDRNSTKSDKNHVI